MIPCVAIFGPTASGKSSLALSLAQEYDGVIISMDSMQIYSGMDIGTAKPSEEEQKLVEHKMIDIKSPGEAFSVYDFKLLAEKEIENAWCRKKIPFLVGGTGLYFDALFNNTSFGEMEGTDVIRKELNERILREGTLPLYEELCRVDPEAAAPLHLKDTKRIVRALEVYHATGIPLTEYKKQSHAKKSPYSFLKISLTFSNRAVLYDRINARVDSMMTSGLLAETRRLLDLGALSNTTASQAIGYKELVPHIIEEKPLDACVELLKQKTRNYAKRQLTWFRRYDDAETIVMDNDRSPIQTAKKYIDEFRKELSIDVS